MGQSICPYSTNPATETADEGQMVISRRELACEDQGDDLKKGTLIGGVRADDLKKGTRVRILTRYKHVDGVVWYENGDEGVVDRDPQIVTIIKVKLDEGYIYFSHINRLEKMGRGEWTKGTRFRTKGSCSNGAGGWLYEKGQEGTALDDPQQIVDTAVTFDRWKHDLTPRISIEEAEFKYLEIVDVQAPYAQAPQKEGTEKREALPSSSSTSAAGGATMQRKHNRWGDTCDAPAAGAREFFPHGWTPSRDVFQAIQVFGHSNPAVSKIRVKGEQLERELQAFGLTTSADYASAVFAYTQEDDDTDLYGKLNGACRAAGGFAEQRLNIYRDYLYHVQDALTTLPNFRGTVYRGIDCAVSPISYAKGKKITWQSFASASKSQQVARKFVREQGRRLSGSMFVIEVKSGKEIDALSAYPAELEVLLKLNFFMTVEAKLEGEAAKKSALPDLAGYEMGDLDVYVLKQV